MDLCKAAERNWGSQVGMWWWEQEGIDLTGARDTAAMVVKVEKDGMEE